MAQNKMPLSNISMRQGLFWEHFTGVTRLPGGAQVRSMGAKCDFQFMQGTPTEDQITNKLQTGVDFHGGRFHDT